MKMTSVIMGVLIICSLHIELDDKTSTQMILTSVVTILSATALILVPIILTYLENK